mmetsp:Transcript_42512/g.112169  ORF Transcript_42512/g.112169 Transcript_42512/m.112169 type:complete len:85 (+) Transcript_42512:748-1002(+)
MYTEERQVPRKKKKIHAETGSRRSEYLYVTYSVKPDGSTAKPKYNMKAVMKRLVRPIKTSLVGGIRRAAVSPTFCSTSMERSIV